MQTRTIARAYGPKEQRQSGIWLVIAAPSTSQPIAPTSAQVSVGVVEDARVLLASLVEQVDEFSTIDAERLRRAVQVEAVSRLVLHLGHEDRLAPQRRGPGDPVALGLHADDLGVGVLRDLADQRLAVAVGHPVARLDALVGVDQRLEFGLTRVR